MARPLTLLLAAAAALGFAGAAVASELAYSPGGTVFRGGQDQGAVVLPNLLGGFTVLHEDEQSTVVVPNFAGGRTVLRSDGPASVLLPGAGFGQWGALNGFGSVGTRLVFPLEDDGEPVLLAPGASGDLGPVITRHPDGDGVTVFDVAGFPTVLRRDADGWAVFARDGRLQAPTARMPLTGAE